MAVERALQITEEPSGRRDVPGVTAAYAVDACSIGAAGAAAVTADVGGRAAREEIAFLAAPTRVADALPGAIAIAVQPTAARRAKRGQRAVRRRRRSDNGRSRLAAAVADEALGARAHARIAHAVAPAEVRKAVVWAAAMHRAVVALPAAAALACPVAQAASVAAAVVPARLGGAACTLPPDKARALAGLAAAVTIAPALAPARITPHARPARLALALPAAAAAVLAAAARAANVFLARTPLVAREALALAVEALSAGGARQPSIGGRGTQRGAAVVSAPALIARTAAVLAPPVCHAV